MAGKKKHGNLIFFLFFLSLIGKSRKLYLLFFIFFCIDSCFLFIYFLLFIFARLCSSCQYVCRLSGSFVWRMNAEGGKNARRKNNCACVNVCACAKMLATSSGSVLRSGADTSVFCQKNFIYFLTLPSSGLFFVTSLLFFKFDSLVEERTTHHVAI